MGIAAIPVGALLLNACGPVDGMENEVALDEASDNWIFWNGAFSEYGGCNDTWDNDGDGLNDNVDPDCHINPGPLRDLSLYNLPIGHNYFPDISKIMPGGPGSPSSPNGFRNPEQITRWFRFLTEPDGNVAGTTILGPGVNPEIVPIPAALPTDLRQGTWAQGNNNNISLRSLHALHLEHGYLPVEGQVAPGLYGAGIAAAQAPASPKIDSGKLPGSQYIPAKNITTSGFTGGWPGSFYRSQGPFGGNGSQGALKAARTGNPR